MLLSTFNANGVPPLNCQAGVSQVTASGPLISSWLQTLDFHSAGRLTTQPSIKHCIIFFSVHAFLNKQRILGNFCPGFLKFRRKLINKSFHNSCPKYLNNACLKEDIKFIARKYFVLFLKYPYVNVWSIQSILSKKTLGSKEGLGCKMPLIGNSNLLKGHMRP